MKGLLSTRPIPFSFLAVRAFGLIPKLRATPKNQLLSHTKFDDIHSMADMFVLINNFWLCADVLSQSQPKSKWLRRYGIKR